MAVYMANPPTKGTLPECCLREEGRSTKPKPIANGLNVITQRNETEKEIIIIKIILSTTILSCTENNVKRT